jgi:hypothetical protein
MENGAEVLIKLVGSQADDKIRTYDLGTPIALGEQLRYCCRSHASRALLKSRSYVFRHPYVILSVERQVHVTEFIDNVTRLV